MLDVYQKHVAERKAEGVVPKPLSAKQVAELVEIFKNDPQENRDFLIELLENRIPPGVDEAAYVKAGLADVAKGNVKTSLLSRERATELLGTMQGGYNIQPLVDLLEDSQLSKIAGDALAQTLLVFDAFHDVQEKMKAGNAEAKRVMQAWADAHWFESKPKLAEKISLTVFKVTGETNTDDLSPAQDAWSRPDIPLHAKAMLKMPRDGITPDDPGTTGLCKPSKHCVKKAILWFMWVTSWVQVHHENQRPTRCFGLWAMTFHMCPTSARVVLFLVVKSRRFSLIRWKMLVRCPLSCLLIKCRWGM